MAKRLSHYIASLESSAEANGDTQVELEYIFFGKVVDFDELKKADKVEDQEQWEIRSEKQGNSPYFGGIRVRKTCGTDSGEPKYVLCAKTMKGKDDGRLETELDVTEDLFNQFKKLAQSGMIKTRYYFNVPDSDLVWEIDVYKTADGEVEPWVKIDLEVKSRKTQIPDFPIELTDVIKEQPGQRTPEQQEQCDKLLKEKFILKNAYDK
jgi:hypothetical protein